MLDSFLVLLCNRLQGIMDADPSSPPKVVLVERPGDSVKFEDDKVSILLVNIQEERVMRSADPFVRRVNTPTGLPQNINPEIRLTLLVLIVGNFKETKTSWQHLSKVLDYFRVNRVVDTKTADQSPDFEQRLQFELVSQTLAEQNELWSVLRAPLHPFLLYRVNLITIRDKEPQTTRVVEKGKIEVEVIKALNVEDAEARRTKLPESTES